MKRAKLLSLFLAGSLLFQTAGIDAMATAPSEPTPISETVVDVDPGLSEQPSENESELKKPTEEESNPEQPSEGEEVKDPAEEDETPEQPSEEENKDEDPAGEDVSPEQPSDTENEGTPSDEEAGETKDSVSENTVSENTISENTLPEDEASIFSIFPGLGENYKFSSQQLADKRVLAAHVGDVVQIDSPQTATIEDYQDADGEYEPGEIVYLAETKEEAEQVAAAFGGTLESYAYDVAVITLPKKATVALAIAAAAEPDIKLPAVWPNYYQYLHTDTNATVTPLTPSDPDFVYQWQHDYIGTRYAWAAGFKGEGITVAVIDTGLDMNHEDLTENAITGKNFVGMGAASDDAVAPDHTTDNQTHGTHVAGIIAANDNSLGGRGIAPDAKVKGYCVFPSDGGANSADVMRAIKAAVGDKVDIINMSLGSPQYNADYEKVVNAAYAAGVAIFASSGNDDTDGNNFPAAYASTISVGAVNENSTRASFSNYGKTVTLSFPGVHIYSTTNNGYVDEYGETYGKYGYMSGTSQASPAAAGTAAVILSARKDIRNMTGKSRVDALLAAMKSSTTKCTDSGMGAGTTYLPDVLKIATDMTAPETPVIEVIEEVNETPIARGTNKKDYIAESIDVTISTKTAVGVDIYYSTDGKAPAYKNGQIINVDNPEVPYRLGDKITLTGAKNITIKAIAVNPFSGKVSKVASKTVTLTPIPKEVIVTPADNVTKIAAGKSLKFTATVELPYAISNKVQWSVDSKAQAAGITVSNGTVKTKATKTATTPSGEYTVIATAVGSDGKTFNGVKGTYTFTVIDAATIKKIAFLDAATNKAPTAKSIKTTDSKTIDADNKVIDLKEYLNVTKTDAVSKADTVLPKEDAAKEVVWSSSNTKVATVSDGVITAKGPGKATIKAISNDGGNKNASYSVTVVQPVTGIVISGPTKVAAGKGVALTATVTPANASNKKLDWTVVDSTGKVSDTVSINKSNGKISTKKGASGTYTVTATAADKLGTAAATYTISIANEEITKITLSNTKLTMFPPNMSAKNNTTATLTATVEGKVGTNTKAEVLKQPLITWTSSAPSIASVNESGVITAKASGKATITCAATDGSNKKATCAVTVSVPMSKLVIGPTDGNVGYIAVSKKVKMAAKYYSNYGTPSNKKIEWKVTEVTDVNDKNVTETAISEKKVSIDKNGTVSVAKDVTPGGSVTVQATAQDGSGVTSNLYTLYIWPNYIAATIAYEPISEDSNSGYFYIAATAYKNAKGKPDWTKAVMIPDYCTASVTGPKNSGLKKVNVQGGYALYQPLPTKSTKLYLDDDPTAIAKLTTKDLDKMSLTIKLKDGSNLSAKDSNIYATYYPKIYSGNKVRMTVGYFSLKRR